MNQSNTFAHIIRLIPVGLLAVVIIYFFPHYNSTLHYHAEIGRPWGYDLVMAEFDFPIYKTEAQLNEERAEIIQNFSPCYVRTHGTNEDPLIAPPTEIIQLSAKGYKSIALRIGNTTRLYPIEDIQTPKSIYQQTGEEREPNIQLDTITSNKLLAEQLSHVSLTQGMVQAGEKIIDRGEIVTESSYQILQSLEQELSNEALNHRQRFICILGDSALIILFILLFVLYMLTLQRQWTKKMSDILFFCILPGLLVILTSLTIRYTSISIYLIPFAWIPILVRVFYDARTALFLHLTTIFIVSLAVSTPFEFLVIQTAVGLVTIGSLHDITRRSQLAGVAGLILLTNALAYTAVTLGQTGNWNSLDWHVYIMMAVNAILVVCVYGLIYLFERAFHLLCSITLVELGNTNTPLLRRLGEVAPGTFQHSMQVGNLAAEGAQAIGANELLVRTGAFYHDIGKIIHPDFCTENQRDGHQNPLLQMASQAAAKVVVSHVSEGMRLAKEYHLPEQLCDFIATHHGTSMARYFYNTAINHGEAVNADDFCYPGPKPFTREQVILMMADGIEARARSLSDTSPESIGQAVDQMIEQQMADGQYDNAPITLQDISTLRQTFKDRLAVIYHHRIAYPTIRS